LYSPRPAHKVINPIIFTKKNYTKACKTLPQVIALEHILGLVCKLYYKSSFKLHDYLDLFSVKDDYEEERVHFSKKNKKATQSAKKKKASGNEADGKSDDEDEQGEHGQYENNFSVLERLVSPLSVPFEFGRTG